jgi:hypothetical protein
MSSHSKSAKTPVGKLQLLGVDFAPEPTREETQADLQALKDATASGQLEVSKLPRSRPIARAVFTDESGAQFISDPNMKGQLLPTTTSERPQIHLNDGVPLPLRA